MSVLFSLFVLNAPLSPEENISLNGYYKSFFVVIGLPDYLVSGDVQTTLPLGSVQNKLRLQMSVHALSWLSMQASYEITPTIQDNELFQNNLFSTGIEAADYRLVDFDRRLYPLQGESVDSFGLFHNMDRLFFSITLPFADLYIGRQAIAWGTAHVVNPTDVIAPYSFNELDTEERRGVDAVRLRIPLGALDELDVGFVAGHEFLWEQCAYYSRVKFNLWNTDFSLLIMGFKQNLLLGFDVTRALGGAGVWLETACILPDFLNPEQGYEDEPACVGISLGADYSFSGELYGFIEYYFNSAGCSRAEDYAAHMNMEVFRDGAVYLMGRHYINLGFTYQIHPLIPINGLLMWNVADLSFMVMLSVEYNLAENIYLTAGAYMGFGLYPELIQIGPGVFQESLNSEFGAYPDMFFTSFRVYF
ncbi:MAG: hypothetical protein JW822_01830 [Spirochaetales bacterium]|nr:hypothetical protein [Spirochaetales bacterium]